ncbi:MAG: hypothetical protein MI757_18540 [Pirellulales bacterium]|nr:hypothetical protein [Pirellulales bacterium]
MTRPAKAPLAAATFLLIAAISMVASPNEAQAQYHPSGAALREQRGGGWGFVRQDSDGRYAGWIKVNTADGRSREHTNYGYWAVQGTSLLVKTDQAPVRHTVQLQGKNLRAYIPAFRTALTFVPAGVYVVGPDGQRRVVDRI